MLIDRIPAGLFITLILLGMISCEVDPDLADPLKTDVFETYDNSGGLAGNQVRDIFRDSEDNLWFACYGSGVTRYDGNSFITYNAANSGLGDDRVICITEDADGDMWFGTASRLYFLVDDTEWYNLALDPNRDVRVNALYRDQRDLVWIGTDGEGIAVYEQGSFYGMYALEGGPDMSIINAIGEDSNGIVWFATEAGIGIADPTEWAFLTLLEGSLGFSALHLDKKGKLWIGSSGGSGILYWAEDDLTELSPFNGQPNIFINDIESDLNGNIWFATTLDGIIKYDGVEMITYKPYNGFPSEDNFCVETDATGNVWIGTYSQGAIKYIPPVHY